MPRQYAQDVASSTSREKAKEMGGRANICRAVLCHEYAEGTVGVLTVRLIRFLSKKHSMDVPAALLTRVAGSQIAVVRIGSHDA
jgi:hypothetical protein